jgi:C1A family cysteine protease
MSKRLASLLFCTILAAGFFVLPAWTQQSTLPTQTAAAAASALPTTYDLRTVDAVTPVKQQLGGTCWTHGTMAAIESNLLLSGKWKALGMKGIPMCSEYHLDWWNGFNKHYNEDVEDPAKLSTGMTVHQGGDYKVAAAYISRADGVVIIPEGWNGADPKAWHSNIPSKSDPLYKRLYVRDIEFFTIGNNLEGIELIKQRIMKEGGMGTAYMSNGARLSKENIHYQPIDSNGDPNHSVCIVGWDDSKISAEENKKAPKPGAWLIKNSWGVNRGDKGYYWISYYDKHAARHPEMGAVSFRNIEPALYDHVCYHDAHGWRDTLPQVSKAFNTFKVPIASGGKGKAGGMAPPSQETIKAISFYTAQHNVNYTLKIYSKFENGKLDGELTRQDGTSEFCGFHTVDLRGPVKLKPGDQFYVYVELSAGGHAIDRTSNIPVLLDQPQPPVKGEQPPAKVEQPPAKDQQPQKKGGKGGGGPKPIVVSKANPGESFYFDGSQWKDLYDYKFENLPAWATAANVPYDHTANFCIKALAVKAQ